MAANEKIFKKEYAPELLKIAENDFISGKALAKVKEVRKETVLFLFEQAVEKALKSVLCHQGKAVPFTHDIYGLVQSFDGSDLPPGGFDLHDLTPYATIRRYEEGKFHIEDSDVEKVSQVTSEVLSWANSRLKI